MDQNKYKNHYHDQEPVLKEKGVSKIREHLTQGMTLFVVIIKYIAPIFLLMILGSSVLSAFGIIKI